MSDSYTPRRRGSQTRRRRKRQFKQAAVLLAALVLFVGGGAIYWFFGRAIPGDRVEIPRWITVDLLSISDYSRPGTPLKDINGIVIHYVGNPGTSAQSNRSYFEGLAQTHETTASAHFVVGLEGEILQCVPLSEIAYCSNSRNGDTVSIEVCHPDDTGEFNAETMESVIRLTAWLCKEFNLDSRDVIRHYDVTGKLCPLYYVEHEDAWDKLKSDVDTRIASDTAAEK